MSASSEQRLRPSRDVQALAALAVCAAASFTARTSCGDTLSQVFLVISAQPHGTSSRSNLRQPVPAASHGASDGADEPAAMRHRGRGPAYGQVLLGSAGLLLGFRRMRAWTSRRRPACAVRQAVAASLASAAVAELSEDEETASWERFSAWLAQRGANLEAVRIGKHDGMRGLFATRDIAAGESIIELPLGACIELADARTADDLCAPAITLLGLRKADQGELEPYFRLLPSRDSKEMATMPDFFTDKELQMLQCPPVAEKTRRRQQLCAQRATEQGLDTQGVTWALCTSVQRSFTVLSPIDGLLRLLLPGIDLINHDADALHSFKVRWQLSDGPVDALFKVVAGSAVKKGEEVRICYGGSPYRPDGCGGDCHGDIAWTNANYLQRYGFIDESIGTTMVDGKWLVTDAAAPVREALSETTVEADEALLASSNLSPAARVAVSLRRHLKRALAAQRAAEAQAVKVAATAAAVAKKEVTP